MVFLSLNAWNKFSGMPQRPKPPQSMVESLLTSSMASWSFLKILTKLADVVLSCLSLFERLDSVEFQSYEVCSRSSRKRI